MREHLDCALFVTPFDDLQVRRLGGSYAAGRLAVHLVDPLRAVDMTRFLAAAALTLRRYDVCLMRVCPDSLSWVRSNLQAARADLVTPVIALTDALKAAALADLHALGVGDFLREPFCAEELRARCERLLARQSRYALRTSSASETGSSVGTVGDRQRHYDLVDPASRDTPVVSEMLPVAALEAYARTVAGRGSTMASLRTAKTQLIQHFETAFIKAALYRHQGNIASAARAVQKHRRAFWALMHKYHIDPEPYRAARRYGIGGESSGPCPGSSPVVGAQAPPHAAPELRTSMAAGRQTWHG